MTPFSLTVITFKFQQPRRWKELGYGLYTAEHVNTLYRMCAAQIRTPHRFVCLTDDPEGVECETMPVFDPVHVEGEDACYRRLKAFDPKWQRSLGTDFILMLDLDAVFLRDLAPVLTEAAEHDLTVLEGSRWLRRSLEGTRCSHYNGSMWLCRAGTHGFLWSDFDPEKFAAQREAYKMPSGQRPLGSDQAWYSVRLGDEANKFTDPDVVQFRSHRESASRAMAVFFAGNTKPWAPGVAEAHPVLAVTYQCFADNKVKPWAPRDRSRALVLMTGPDIWADVEQEIARPYDGVIAHPFAAQHWPGPVDALAMDAEEAFATAKALGFEEVTFCGTSMAGGQEEAADIDCQTRRPLTVLEVGK